MGTTEKTSIRKEIDPSGNVHYYNEQDRFHREDGPAIECINGDKHWYQNGKLHREDGPAIEWYDGDKEWYQNGKLHRVDGPAIECSNGDKSWWYNNEFIGDFFSGCTQKKFERWVRLRTFS